MKIKEGEGEGEGSPRDAFAFWLRLSFSQFTHSVQTLIYQ